MQIRLRQYSFQISERYSPGQAIGETEAQVLNWLRAKGIRRRLEGKWPPGVGPLSQTQRASMERICRELDEDFDMAAPRPGGSPPRRQSRGGLGPFDLELEKLAWEEARAQMARQGRAMDQAELGEFAKELAQLPQLQAEATRRVAVQEQINREALESLIGSQP